MTGFLVTALLTFVVHDTDPNRTLHRLRTTDPMVVAVIQAGQQRSPTFATLVESVEQSDAMVYVYIVRAYALPHGMDGCLVLDGDGSPIRYLKVILAMGTPADRMIVVLAHELQHVREVLDARIPNDRAAMETLFERIGTRQRGSATGEQYETAAAQHVTAVVVSELRTPRHRDQP